MKSGGQGKRYDTLALKIQRLGKKTTGSLPLHSCQRNFELYSPRHFFYYQCYWNERRGKLMRIILAVAVFTALFSCGPAQAANDEDWSFLLHPAVPYDDLTFQQKNRYDDENYANRDEEWEHFCARSLQTFIDFYVEKYPGFAAFADNPKWRQRWIDAFSIDPYLTELSCLKIQPAMHAWEAFIDSQNESTAEKPYYCGKFSDRKVPPDLAKGIDTLIWLAFEKENSSAVWNLMSTSSNNRRNPVYLNADVAYYLVQRLEWRRATEEFDITAEGVAMEYENRHYSLSPARRREVVKAAHRGDARAILDTTAECHYGPGVRN